MKSIEVRDSRARHNRPPKGIEVRDFIFFVNFHTCSLILIISVEVNVIFYGS